MLSMSALSFPFAVEMARRMEGGKEETRTEGNRRLLNVIVSDIDVTVGVLSFLVMFLHRCRRLFLHVSFSWL